MTSLSSGRCCRWLHRASIRGKPSPIHFRCLAQCQCDVTCSRWSHVDARAWNISKVRSTRLAIALLTHPSFPCVWRHWFAGVTSCRRLVMRNSTVEGANLPGVFILLHSKFNDRPVYTHSSLDLFLYFYSDSSLSAWVVGPVLGSRTGVMYTYDVGVDPAALSGSWTCLDGNVWVVDPQTSFDCILTWVFIFCFSVFVLNIFLLICFRSFLLYHWSFLEIQSHLFPPIDCLIFSQIFISYFSILGL